MKSYSFSLPLAVAGLVLLSGCGRQPLPETKSEAKTAVPLNCIVIVLDAAAGPHFSHMGYARPTTPHIDALAAQGTVFRNASSVSSTTLSSAVAYLTGRYLPKPAKGAFPWMLTDEAYSIAEAFQDKGFKTASFSENPFMAKALGFPAGFDSFVSFPVTKRYPNNPEAMTKELMDKATEWVHENAESPFFLYLHLLRPHNDYFAPEPYLTKFAPGGLQMMVFEDGREAPMADWLLFVGMQRNNPLTRKDGEYVAALYDGNLAYGDALVGEFVDALTQSGVMDRTLLIVTADHGEAFMKHGFLGHNTTVYQDMIHVPLVFTGPQGGPVGQGTYDTPVSLIDLFPTLAEIFSLEPRHPLHGRSLVPALRGERFDTVQDVYAITHTFDQFTIRRGNLKLMMVPQGGDTWTAVGLYDLSADPDEQNNILPATPEDQWKPMYESAMRYAAEHWSAIAKVDANVSQETIDQLKSLGYVVDNKPETEK